MSVEIRPLAEDDADKWNRAVDRAPHSNPFHRFESLQRISEHGDVDLYALMGYKGQEVVGLFPVFEGMSSVVRVLSSPPPDLAISYLGPVLLNVEKLGRRKRDKRHTRFIEGCLAWIEEHLKPRFTHVRTTPGYDDIRPFQWNGFRATPAHTYHVDLTVGEEDLLMNFSRDARTNILTGDEVAFSIEVGGPDTIKRIIDQVRERHGQLGEPYRLSADFAVDLYATLPEGRLTPYELRVDEEPVGGMLVLWDDRTVYRWQGGAKTDVDIPATDLLDWHIMRDGLRRSRKTYDLVYANNPRINRYKSKFNPSVRPYYELEQGSMFMRAAASIYRTVRK